MYITEIQVKTNFTLFVERELEMDKQKEEKSATDVYDNRLIGTFTLVLIIGAVILMSWAAVFYYYITTV